MIIFKILGLLLAGVGGVLGIATDFKHKDGPKAGKVTKYGLWAIALLSLGLASNVIIAVSDEMSKKNQHEIEKAKLLLDLQARAVSRIVLKVHMKPTAQIPYGATLVGFLQNRLGNTCRLVIPLNSDSLSNSRRRQDVIPGAFSEERQITSSVFHAFEVHGISISNGELQPADRFFQIFGDLHRVTLSFSVPESIAVKNKTIFNTFYDGFEVIQLAFDGILLTNVEPKDAPPPWVSSTRKDPEWVNAPASEIMFYRSVPQWNKLFESSD